MIKVEDLTFSYLDKDLYNKISFSIENGMHHALIGSNGCGKTTLMNMIMDDEEYIYKGKIEKEENLRTGFVTQFAVREEHMDLTVFEYLSKDFVDMINVQEELCGRMATEEDLESIYEMYQKELDEFAAVDGDNYESNIRKELKTAGLSMYENIPVSGLSGGEFKLVSVIRQMLKKPALLVMDEPDVFLDFENLCGLKELINSYKGTLVVITHNRYILNHCFNKILHLENGLMQEFLGSYNEYMFSLLAKKVELSELAKRDMAEIERNREVVNRMRADATRIACKAKGNSLKARVSLLKRLEERRIKEPFLAIRKPEIVFKNVEIEENKEAETLLEVKDFSFAFEDEILRNVSFEIKEGEKVAIVGKNGTGKTTLIRELIKNENDAIRYSENASCDFFSQLYNGVFDENAKVYEEFMKCGFDNRRQVTEYLEKYCLDEEVVGNKIGNVSGGEKNILQIARMCLRDSNMLILDEPTSHLDIYAGETLEKAISEYNGAVLMVSHDFYNICECADHILYVEDKTVRKMSKRAFRKMVYANYFDKDYLEYEDKKKELELGIEKCLEKSDVEGAKMLLESLEEIVSSFS